MNEADLPKNSDAIPESLMIRETKAPSLTKDNTKAFKLEVLFLILFLCTQEIFQENDKETH